MVAKYPFEQPDPEGGGASPWSAEGYLALTGVLGKPGTGTSPAWRPEDGMIAERSLALGASTLELSQERHTRRLEPALSILEADPGSRRGATGNTAER